ncbi:hypothetical protein [Sphingobium sp. AP50]|uniref:hypothetical protein n=1 Tax=Sphingobium sp. AP50 TaxID=1884369 RepID=UPI00116086E4|nr:hypothetical protein [Sphingobium sp. AP50]
MGRGALRIEEIEEVGIDAEGRIYICPTQTSFDHIYRAAMEVYWDKSKRRLHSPIPRKLSVDQWFSQILAAAVDEYGIQLKLQPSTLWVNVPEEVRSRLQATPT